MYLEKPSITLVPQNVLHSLPTLLVHFCRSHRRLPDALPVWTARPIDFSFKRTDWHYILEAQVRVLVLDPDAVRWLHSPSRAM